MREFNINFTICIKDIQDKVSKFFIFLLIRSIVSFLVLILSPASFAPKSRCYYQPFCNILNLHIGINYKKRPNIFHLNFSNLNPIHPYMCQLFFVDYMPIIYIPDSQKMALIQ